MGNKIIVPFNDKKGGTYELNIDLDKLSKGEMLNAIVGIGRTSQQLTSTGDKSGILSGLSCNSFVSKINKAKKLGEVPFPSKNVRENKINYGKGLDYIYGTKPLNDQAEDLNPFASNLQKIKPSASESEKLSWFKSAIVEAKSVNELHKNIDQVLASGARLNACNDGEWSIAEYVVLGTHFHRLEKSDRKEIMRKLMLSGAEFHDTLLEDKLIGEIYNELQPEIQPQIDKQLEGLRKVGESAIQGGSVEDVEIDNRTVFIKFSESSTVEPAKVLEGLEGWGSHIIKIGNNEVEVKVEKGGERNYTSLSDDSDFTMTLHSDLGEVKIRLCHDRENYDRVQVIVEDKEMWQKAGGVIRENCLFGGMTVKEAVEKGNFMRCGIWNSKQLMKEVDSPSEKLFSWADKVRENSKETCRAL